MATLGVALAACGSADERGFGEPGVGGLSGLDGDATDGADTDGASPDGGSMDDSSMGTGARFDLGPDDGPAPGDGDECAAVSDQTELVPAAADIIFVVDNSGSMEFEAGEIQARMNDFSSQIIASGIDVHVVLISSYPYLGNGICIAPPLGGGGCPLLDSNPPLFTHVNQPVDSHNAWELLLLTHPLWRGTLRPDSNKHLVVVTDDTSNMGWAAFDTLFTALDPSDADYRHHSVVCHSDCQSAAGIGSDYIMLSNQTGAVAADLCDQDFQSVFDVLTTEVIDVSQLSCEFEIPPPPDGQEFVADEVNVEFDDGMGGTLSIGRVDSPAQCANVADGWYYDDPANPSTIQVCPQTCDELQGYDEGSVRIQFGCASIPAG
ncbi:MAG: hypothetical protein AAGF11_09345 [Myxococcota bacterium]